MTTAERTISTQPLHIRVSDVVAKHGDPPWAERILHDGRNDAVLICDVPGAENDPHVHPDFVEWWIVLQGEMVWEIGDYPPVRATKGDVVMAPKGQRHAIKTVGTENSLRLGVTMPGSNHDVKARRSNILKPFPKQDGPPNMLHTTQEFMLEQVRRPALVDIDTAGRPEQREPDLPRSGNDEQRALASRFQRVVDDHAGRADVEGG